MGRLAALSLIKSRMKSLREARSAERFAAASPKGRAAVAPTD
jgi:hypothetical protein